MVTESSATRTRSGTKETMEEGMRSCFMGIIVRGYGKGIAAIGTIVTMIL
jgi:hypothetical protein